MKVGFPRYTAHGLGRLSSGILNRERPNLNFHLFPWSFEPSHKGLWSTILLPSCGGNRPVWESIFNPLRLRFGPGKSQFEGLAHASPGPSVFAIIGTTQPFAEGYDQGVNWAFVSVILLSASWSRLDCLPHCLHSLHSTHLPFILTIATACHLSVL